MATYFLRNVTVWVVDDKGRTPKIYVDADGVNIYKARVKAIDKIREVPPYLRARLEEGEQ